MQESACSILGFWRAVSIHRPPVRELQLIRPVLIHAPDNNSLNFLVAQHAAAECYFEIVA
jgi:hypothetical protein